MEYNLPKNEYQDRSSNEFIFWANKAKSPLKNFEEVLLKDLIQSNAELNIIEAGTGSGRISASIIKKNTKLSIDAFDSSNSLLEVASKENSKYGIKFFHDDIIKLKNLPKNKKYDYALYLGQVISCVDLKNQKKSLIELLKFLKKGGVLYISFCSHSCSIFIYLRNMITIFLRFILTGKYDYHKIPRFRVTGTKFKLSRDVTWWHNKESAINLLNNAGYKVEKCFYRKELLNGKGPNGFIYIKAVSKK